MREVRFKTLEIENFRCHKELTFNFEPNRFCVITGPNGAGKTSVLDSVCYCLYDETTKGRKGDDVIRKRSGKNMSITIDFSIDNDEYRIENYRKHFKHRDGKVLIKNGSVISGANRAETNKRIEDILMPKDVFLNCLLFSQYINKPFTELTDSGQKSIFDRMMGFTKYNEYSDNCKVLIKKCVETISKLQESVLLLAPSLERGRELLHNEQKSKEEFINNQGIIKKRIGYEISEKLSLCNTLKEEVKDLDKFTKRRDELRNISNNYESKILSTKNDIKDKITMIKNNII